MAKPKEYRNKGKPRANILRIHDFINNHFIELIAILGLVSIIIILFFVVEFEIKRLLETSVKNAEDELDELNKELQEQKQWQRITVLDKELVTYSYGFNLYATQSLDFFILNKYGVDLKGDDVEKVVIQELFDETGKYGLIVNYKKKYHYLSVSRVEIIK